jgi:hypothetical protein
MSKRHILWWQSWSFRGAMFCCVLALVTVAESAEDTDYIRQYQFEPASSGHPLVLKEVPRPVAGASDVVVRVKAVSRRW